MQRLMIRKLALLALLTSLVVGVIPEDALVAELPEDIQVATRNNVENPLASQFAGNSANKQATATAQADSGLIGQNTDAQIRSLTTEFLEPAGNEVIHGELEIHGVETYIAVQ